VTQQGALRLREMIILRIAQRQTLANCVHLRAQRVEELIDKCIYENGTSGKMNGMRMAEMHKAHGCAQCKRLRKAKNRVALEKWQDVDEKARGPPPKEVFYQFDDCELCFGRSFIYEGRPYSVYEVLDGAGAPMPDELVTLRTSLGKMYEETCVRLADGVRATKPAQILADLTTDETTDQRQRQRRGRKKQRRVVVNGKVVLNAAAAAGRGGGSKWTVQEQQTEKALAVDRFIFNNFRDRSMDDKNVDELLRSDPHGIAKWLQSEDGKIYLVTSISTFCANKARVHPREPMHGRSQVYFVISDDGSVVQRCHAEKAYGGMSCKKYRSSPRFLPREIVDLLWPPPLVAHANDDDVVADGNAVDFGYISRALPRFRDLFFTRTDGTIDSMIGGGGGGDVQVDNSIDGNGGNGGGDDGDEDDDDDDDA